MQTGSQSDRSCLNCICCNWWINSTGIGKLLKTGLSIDKAVCKTHSRHELLAENKSLKSDNQEQAKTIRKLNANAKTISEILEAMARPL